LDQDLLTVAPVIACIALVAAMVLWGLTHPKADEPVRAIAPDPVAPPESLQRILVRVYEAPQQQDAVAAFQLEATKLADDGYRPGSQSWAQGEWGCGAWLVALLLCLVLVGILVFIFMIIVHPAGCLTVTYELSGGSMATEAQVFAGATDAGSQSSVRDRLAQLDDLHGSGVVTDEEYAAKRARILDQL
jgi:hypothetical protein